MNIQQIRLEGIGKGFRVIDPHDGYRKNDQLWFGTCSVCEESVSNSYRDGVWQHHVYTQLVYYGDSATPNSTTSHQVDYCPVAEGKVTEPVILRKELA